MIKFYCDGCGDQVDTINHFNEVISIKHTFGYGSKRDGDSVDIDLCESCFTSRFEDILTKDDAKEEEK